MIELDKDETTRAMESIVGVDYNPAKLFEAQYLEKDFQDLQCNECGEHPIDCTCKTYHVPSAFSKHFLNNLEQDFEAIQ